MADSDNPAPRIGAFEEGFLPIERRLLRFSVNSLVGFLAIRLILATNLFLQILSLPPLTHGWRWIELIPLAYAAAAGALYWLRKKGKLSDALSLGSFMLDVGTSLAVLHFTEGANSGNTYTALLLLIMGSCLLQRPLLIFAVTVVVGLIYGFMTPPPAAELLHFNLLRLSLFLLIALFTTHIADYAALIERQTATRYEEHLAWMQRLSLVGQGMAAVLHEAKTPLGTIVLSAESAATQLREGKDPGEELRAISEQADYASAILQNFLDFVKPTQLDLEPLPLHEPLRKALSMAKVSMDERGVELDLHVREDCAVRGSPRHLLQAFANILNNAVDAMPSGGRLTIRMEKRGAQARVEFADTGVGMSPEALTRLFEPFSTSKAGASGHGLGLSIVRWILQEHGGEINIKSDGLGRGSRVTVALPLAQP